ncbi:aspartate/glutamate racemase family protein [Celerinatantimonas sp. YJH-8]|uniref:aspartate/glutamate racemase family protein n=1 Tax=Celerinatantimonas sp. YJH-8 TaxID=3228714 RepID=UPI0038C57ABA
MQIHLLNPNTCQAMTLQMAEAAKAVALPSTVILPREPEHGPLSIECARDEVIASAALLDEIQKAETLAVDAHIIACFGDPGLDAAREIASVPVIGIAEAAFHLATLVSYRFAVVTTMKRTIATAEHLLGRYGFEQQCSGIYASDLAVLDLEQLSGEHYELLLSDCRRALAEGAEAIVLGCAGMAYLAGELSGTLGVPVIDGVCAAVKLAESLSQLGLSIAKSGQYGAPYPKLFKGRYQHWSQR